MYVGGEIRELAAIGLPEIGIVTAIQPVHQSRIGSLDAIVDAKAELLEALPPAADGGLAILNADDERVRRMAGADARPDDDLRLRRRRRRPRGRTSNRSGLDGMRFRLADAGRRAGRGDPGPRATRRAQRPGRRGGRAGRRPQPRRRRARAGGALAGGAPIDR